MATKDTVKDAKAHEKKVKEPKVKEPAKEVEQTPALPRYFAGVGRRKTAVARVRIFEETSEGERDVMVNDRAFKDYFPTQTLQGLALAPVRSVGLENRFRVSVRVRGGGVSGQAAAMSLGLARAIVAFNAEHRPLLKSGKFLSRDARKVERKKPGLKKARRAPQWSKR